MKKIIAGIGLILTIAITFVAIRRFIDYNSILNKNTRGIEQNFTQDTTSENYNISGNVSGLINLDYDKMFVLEPYQSKEEMEKQIGFKYSKLQERVSEGNINILFTKKIAQLHICLDIQATLGIISIYQLAYTQNLR